MNPVYHRALQDYERYYDQGYAAIANYEQYATPLDIEYTMDQPTLASHQLLFSTATGVYWLDTVGSYCRRLLKGKYYGLTRCGSYWLAARSNAEGYRDQWRNERLTDVCRFKVANGTLYDLSVVLCGLPGEVHQMDVFEETLYLPHTDYNQVLTLPVQQLLQTDLPLGLPDCASIHIPIQRPSHLNSIYLHGEYIELIAHNFTMYSQRLSDWVRYHRPTGTITVHPLQAHSAHNIWVDQSDYWYCDSNHHHFCHNKIPVFEAPKLLRGLSLNDRCWYIGGSDVSYDRYERYSSTSSIYVLEREGYALQQTYHFPDLGDVYDIRQANGMDATFSQSYHETI